MENQAKKDFLLNLSFIAAMVFLFYITANFLLFYLLPFVLAVVIALAVQKPARLISQKTKIKINITAPISAALLYIFLAGIILIIIYGISRSLSDILKDYPYFFDIITDFASKIQKSLSKIFKEISPEFTKQINLLGEDMLEGLRLKLTNSVSKMAAGIAKRTPTFLLSSIITLVASCYIAKDFCGLKKFTEAMCGEKLYAKILKIKNILYSSVLKIAKGYLILLLITFAELTLGFFIAGIKYSLLLAFLIAVIDLLPAIGTGVALIPWSAIELISGNTFKGALLLVIYIIVTVVRNFAEPKIIGAQIGINPLFTLLAMFIGLRLFGFAGLFILPVALIVIIKYYKAEIDEEKGNYVS